MASGQRCVLLQYTNCADKTEDVQEVSSARCISLSSSSKLRGDTLHSDFNVDDPENSTVLYIHRTCASTYTSKHHIKRHISRATLPEPEVKIRHSRSAFSYKDHCLICGEACALTPDTKNPARWRRVVQCRTADRQNKQTFKEVLFQTTCHERNDEWASDVKTRLDGVLSDLHAADEVYHKDCMTKFRGKRNIAKSFQDNESLEDEALTTLVNEMKENQSRIWNSIELSQAYREHNGDLLSRKQLMEKLSDLLGNDIVIMSIKGMASILAFKSKACAVMKLVYTDDEGDCDVEKVTKVISKECQELKPDTSEYQIRLSRHDIMSSVSPTLQKLLSSISSKLKDTLPAGMVGNIITGIVTTRPKPLQVALGIVLREKSAIEQFYDFGVSASII